MDTCNTLLHNCRRYVIVTFDPPLVSTQIQMEVSPYMPLPKETTIIETGNAHKEGMLPQTLINTFEKCERGGIETSWKWILAAK